MSFDEVTTDEEVAEVVAIFAEAAGKKGPKSVKIDEEAVVVPAELRRQSAILTEPVFQKYHSKGRYPEPQQPLPSPPKYRSTRPK